MASARTICTECKSVVTLPEPAEVGDVVPCPKCEAYFTVPKTKIVPMPGAAKPGQAAAVKPIAAVPSKPKPKVVVEEEDEMDFTSAPPPKKKPVAVVEDDDEDDDEEDEEEEKPKKKKKRSDGDSPKKKKKKKKDDEEKSFKNSPLRFVILGVLLVIMLVGAYLLYKKEWTKPDIVIPAKEDDLSKPITQAEIDANVAKNKNKGGGPQTGLPSVDRQKATSDLKQLGLAYQNYHDQFASGPKTASDLLPFVENNAALIKNVTDGIYVITMNVKLLQLPGGTSNTILGYVHDVPQKGGVVLFADGSVRNLSKQEFDAAPKAGNNKVGANPPQPATPLANSKTVKADLMKIAEAYMKYSYDHMDGPNKPDDLAPFVGGNTQIIRNMNDGLYVVIMKVQFKKMFDKSQIILGYTRDTPEKGGLVLLVRGEVVQMTKEEFASTPQVGN